MLDQLRSSPPKTLEEALVQNDALWAVVGELESMVTDLKGRNEELQEQVRELGERIGKSSRNSSRPPSSDSTAQRKNRSKKPKSQKRKGAQPGHQKHERPLVPETDVDEIQRYFPAALCGCGGSVAIEPDPRCRHQVFDFRSCVFRLSSISSSAGSALAVASFIVPRRQTIFQRVRWDPIWWR